MASQNYTVSIFPQAPGGLIGSPQGPGIITLTWTASPSTDIVGYRIRRGLSTGNYNTIINVGNVNQYVDTGLTSGTTYFYTVSAVSASGVESAGTNEVQVTAP
jgi:fibronectin type 3 domain-containing protein